MNGRFAITRLEQRLDRTFSRVDQLGADLEIRADFARYLCILVSGYVEKAVVALVLAYCRTTSSPNVQRYVESRIKRLANVNKESLLQLMGNFDTDWRTQIEAFVTDEREAALNSVVDLRNQIAHGNPVAVSFNQIRDYYAHIRDIISKLANLLDPN